MARPIQSLCRARNEDDTGQCRKPQLRSPSLDQHLPDAVAIFLIAGEALGYMTSRHFESGVIGFAVIAAAEILFQPDIEADE
jgi:hypothetical protein